MIPDGHRWGLHNLRHSLANWLQLPPFLPLVANNQRRILRCRLEPCRSFSETGKRSPWVSRMEFAFAIREGSGLRPCPIRHRAQKPGSWGMFDVWNLDRAVWLNIGFVCANSAILDWCLMHFDNLASRLVARSSIRSHRFCFDGVIRAQSRRILIRSQATDQRNRHECAKGEAQQDKAVRAGTIKAFSHQNGT